MGLFKVMISNEPALIFTIYGMWIGFGITNSNLPIHLKFVGFLFGLINETFLEYMFHRWVQHFPLWLGKISKTWTEKSEKRGDAEPIERKSELLSESIERKSEQRKLLSERIYHVVHGHHHRHPQRLPFFPLPHSQVIVVSWWFFLNAFLSRDWAWSIAVGGVSGLIIFELGHLTMHKKWISSYGNQTHSARYPFRSLCSRIIKNFLPLEEFHLYHHVDKTVAFGFICPFWDKLFGTVPEHMQEYFKWYLMIPFPIISFYLIGKRRKEKIEKNNHD